MRLLSLCLCAATTALAQFAQLSTTANGSDLYFTTELRQPGSTQSHDPKLFRLRSSELSLVNTQSCDVPGLTGACGISELHLSDNGAIAAYQSRMPCTGGSSCIFRELSLGILI